MILEDAHWADPTSMEAFSRAVDRTRTLGVTIDKSTTATLDLHRR
jgi:predicted ATPase